MGGLEVTIDREGDSVDIGLALTYVTKDPQWVKKVLIGGLIILVSSLFAIILIGFLGFFIFAGYGVRTIRNVIDGVEHPLPDWDDFGGDLARGFKVWVGSIIWAVPVWVLGICAAIISASGSDAASVLALFMQICLILPLGILISMFISPTILGRFAETEEIGSMLQVSEIIAEIRGLGVVPFLLYFVLTLIAGFLGSLGLILCLVGVVFTAAYAGFATFHGVGQIRRQIRGISGGVVGTEHPAF